MYRFQDSSDGYVGQEKRGGLSFGLGILLAIAAGILLHWVPSQPRLDVYAVALAAIGAVYVGSALAEKWGRIIFLEAAIATTCIALALIGLWVSPLALIAGYILHGIWDFFHHPVHVGAQIPQRWYPPLCVGFDWAIALVITLQYSLG
ncbi:DUF6010 family protein [Sphaerothrix gracilis]|uniref:DUF6010 family protein n=1 Tax=Sphaerothrix gracilis TaxID=3151835 RepID=UPI0031FCA714